MSILRLARQSIQPVTLNYIYRTGKYFNNTDLIKYSNFLQKEIPVRLAKRVVDIQNLPYGLPSMGSVKNVGNLYSQSCQKILDFPLVFSF